MMDMQVTSVTMDEVNNALKEMRKGKTGANGSTTGLIKDAGHSAYNEVVLSILLESKYHQTKTFYR